MRFYTDKECEDWLRFRDREKPNSSNAEGALTIWYPPNPAAIDFSWLAQTIFFRDPVLLWITEWGIWPSTENWHLYYRLRQSYGNTQLLDEAPGHFFLNYEMEDLATFMQVAVTNGWGGYILTQANYVNAFFSHDEYMDFFSSNQSTIENLRRRYADLIKPPSSFHSVYGRSRISAAGESLSPAEIHSTPQDSDKK